MSELDFNRKYHIAHILNSRFDELMYDIYTGMDTTQRPPYLEDMFIETTQVQALILLEEERRNNFPHINSHEWEDLYQHTWNNEEFAKLKVFDEIKSNDVLKNVVDDIFKYISFNRMSILSKTTHLQTHYSADVIHAPVREVW